MKKGVKQILYFAGSYFEDYKATCESNLEIYIPILLMKECSSFTNETIAKELIIFVQNDNVTTNNLNVAQNFCN